MSTPNQHVCNNCKKSKDVDKFKLTWDGYQKTCWPCLQARWLWFRKKNAPETNKENIGGDLDKNNDDSSNVEGLSELKLDAFLDAISVPDITEFAAHVDVLTTTGSLCNRANTLAKLIWERLHYQFMWVSFHKGFMQWIMLIMNLLTAIIVSISINVPRCPAFHTTVLKSILNNINQEKADMKVHWSMTRTKWTPLSVMDGFTSLSWT